MDNKKELEVKDGLDEIKELHESLSEEYENNQNDNESDEELNLENLKDKLTQRMQELLVVIDEYEVGSEQISDEEYEDAVKEYKEIKKDLKQLAPKQKQGFWENISVWMLIYSFVQLFLCFPAIGVQFNLTVQLSNYIDQFINISSADTFGYIINICIIFSFTIINLIAGLIILIFTLQSKNKTNKIYFGITYGLMVVCTAISIIIMFA